MGIGLGVVGFLGIIFCILRFCCGCCLCCCRPRPKRKQEYYPSPTSTGYPQQQQQPQGYYYPPQNHNPPPPMQQSYPTSYSSPTNGPPYPYIPTQRQRPETASSIAIYDDKTLPETVGPAPLPMHYKKPVLLEDVVEANQQRQRYDDQMRQSHIVSPSSSSTKPPSSSSMSHRVSVASPVNPVHPFNPVEDKNLKENLESALIMDDKTLPTTYGPAPLPSSYKKPIDLFEIVKKEQESYLLPETSTHQGMYSSPNTLQQPILHPSMNSSIHSVEKKEISSDFGRRSPERIDSVLPLQENQSQYLKVYAHSSIRSSSEGQSAQGSRLSLSRSNSSSSSSSKSSKSSKSSSRKSSISSKRSSIVPPVSVVEEQLSPSLPVKTPTHLRRTSMKGPRNLPEFPEKSS